MIRKAADWFQNLFAPVVQPSAAEYVLAYRERQRREMLELHAEYHKGDPPPLTLQDRR